MKKNIFWLAAFLFLSLKINAQSPGPKWEKIFETRDESVFIDTSTIKQFEKQISVLSITYYKTPKMISSIGSEAASVKNQLLFNQPLKKYTLIGTLYYDKNLKILGETSLPGFASSSDNFSLPIEGNASMSAIFNRAVDYLKSTQPAAVEKSAQSESKDLNDKSVPDKADSKQNGKTQAQDTSATSDRVALYLSKRDSVERAAAQVDQKKNDTPKKSETKTAVTKEPVKTLTEKKAAPASDSSQEQETNPKSTIFKQGGKYSFQVSSWRNKSKAESEVRRLSSKGHNSFLAEGLVKGVTWYRVRIGYFNTLEETEAYMKKMK